jgi:RNA polymerase sigma factor (sigma-70 family)
MARNTHQLTSEPAESSAPADERWRRMWNHREHLLRVARRRSMSVEDAEDAVHEAMIRAWENPNIDDERLAAWLTTVTMRLCVDRYRQLNRESEASSRSALAAPAPVPVDELVCDRAEAKWLARRSRSLPARQAEALRLKSEDLDVAQVATEMGLSYEATESLLARARRALRTSLASTLALAAWLGRGRFETGGAQAAAVASTAATLAVLGITLPFTYDVDEDRPRSPGVSRSDVVDEPARERAKDEPVPAPDSKARPDSGPTGTPGPGQPLTDATSLVPNLTAPTAPDIPGVPEVPSGLPDIPDVPSLPADVRLSTVTPKHSLPEAPLDVDLPRAELPGSGDLPAEIGDLRD